MNGPMRVSDTRPLRTFGQWEREGRLPGGPERRACGRGCHDDGAGGKGGGTKEAGAKPMEVQISWMGVAWAYSKLDRTEQNLD